MIPNTVLAFSIVDAPNPSAFNIFCLCNKICGWYLANNSLTSFISMSYNLSIDEKSDIQIASTFLITCNTTRVLYFHDHFNNISIANASKNLKTFAEKPLLAHELGVRQTFCL